MTSKRESPDLGDEALAQLFAAHVASTDTKGLSGDYYYDYEGFVLGAPADEALAMVVRLCERAPDDSALCWVGVVFVEPLLDLHWRTIGDRFEREAAKRPSLRKAYSCAWLSLPRRGREFEARLEALIQPGEDVGRQKS